MRILHISTRLILGGSQENTILSCEGQAQRGHDVHLAYGPIYGPEGSMLDRVKAFNGGRDRGIEGSGDRADRSGDGTTNGGAGAAIHTHEIPDLIRAVSPLRDLRCLRQLRTLIETIRPDIVHTHSSKAGILGRLAAWKVCHRSDHARPAVVHTIHGSPFHAFQNYFVNRAYVASERFAAKRCHAIVSVADAMTKQYLAEGIGRPEQYTTVYSGMETETFLTPAPGEARADVRSRLGLTDADFVIGTVARLAELKGHDDLLAALAADLKAKPHWKLLWVGDGWHRERLVGRARSLGLRVAELDRKDSTNAVSAATATGSSANSTTASIANAQLIITGLVPPDRVPGLMRAMDMLAHPSYREGLPRTVPQALLAGTCPVAYDCDGASEVCIEMQTGRLVKPADKAGLREAIAWLAEHPLERSAMANKGRELCRERFSAKRMVDDLEEVYRRALAAADASRGSPRRR